MTASVDVSACAYENAAWCAAVCATHDLPTRMDRTRWWSPRRTLPLYSDAVSLAPGLTADDLLGGLEVSHPGVSVKDSFGDVDLTGSGFSVLFTATWVTRAATPPVTARPPDLRWAPVTTAAELREWRRVWDPAWTGPDLFLPALLDIPGIVLGVGRGPDGRLRAGAALHHAVLPGGGAVVGVSNTSTAASSSTADAPDEPWGGAAALAAALFPGVPLVGYERGADLLSVRRCGWEPVGSLRVWARPHPST